MSDADRIGQRPGLVDRLRAVARHRAARLVVVAAMLLLVARVLSGQPSAVQVEYRLGAASAGLTDMQVRYFRGSTEVRRVRFFYERGPGAAQVHEVLLPDGEYRLELDLAYAEAERRVVRPLIVDGAGRVTVFVQPE